MATTKSKKEAVAKDQQAETSQATDGGPNPNYVSEVLPVAEPGTTLVRLPVAITLEHPDAVAPEYETEGAACFDLRAMVPQGEVTVDHHRPHVFDTGIKFEVPEGHAMLIFSRSGHGFKNDTRLANCVGILDSDFRGTAKVKLRMDASNVLPLPVRHKDRIAQAMIIPVDRVAFYLKKELSETERGENGYGSTGNE